MNAEYVLELPSEVQAVEQAVDLLIDRCRDVGFDAERLRLNFRVGVTEALVNAVLYGNDADPAKNVRVEARFEPESVVVRVTDEGSGFDPEELPDPTLPDNRERTGGRGIYLIQQLMDRVDFNERGNSITMKLLRDPGRADEATLGGAR